MITRIRTLLLSLLAFGAGVHSVNGADNPTRFGKASYYHAKYIGRLMANGERYDATKYTLATWDYPLNTLVVIEHRGNRIIARVTDRGPAKNLVAAGRRFDLSFAAFRALADPKLGLIDVTVWPVLEARE